MIFLRLVSLLLFKIELRAATREQRIVANSSTVALSAPNLNFAAEQYDLKFSSPRSMQVAVGSAQLNVNADSGWRPDGSGNQEVSNANEREYSGVMLRARLLI